MQPNINILWERIYSDSINTIPFLFLIGIQNFGLLILVLVHVVYRSIISRNDDEDCDLYR